MKVPSCRILPFLLLALMGCINVSHSRKMEQTIPLDSVRRWARDFGRKIFDITKRATGITKLAVEYESQRTVVEQVKGKKLVQKLARQMENMLQKKVKAVKKLADAAEKAILNYKNDSGAQQYDYYNAKKLVPDTVVKNLPGGTLDASKYRFIHLDQEKRFHGIAVNSSVSTVHVPTNVFDKSSDVVNGIAWSSQLDKQFKQNAKNDSSLMWQYFGSSTGFFRIYPGMIWPRNNKDGNVDMFDCRVRGWYIQAATFPKDMVILLDSSGSMHGLRAAIARSTVGKILDTLSDNDFFNIIYFNKKPNYLDDCLNRTLVQANTDNRRRLREAIVGKAKAKDVANFELALIEAFELFEHTKNKSKGTGCYTNKVIMLITDGAPENYEWVFQKYNWGPNNTVDVRVFTYLIGREVSDSRQVRWMACVNKGYHTHISTLADVQENVQKYIKVLSRPTQRDKDKNVAWSPVYLDFIQSLEDQTQLDTLAQEKRLQLMTSVAQPVFDKRNDTKGEGKLLGVVGTDVLISDLTKLTSKFLLGVNGYSFVVTNNGYLLFHPELRPAKWQNQKPNYNSVALTEVESAKRAEELKIAMTNREVGSMVIRSKIKFNDMQRVTLRNTSFFYAPIGRNNIPFSLGIALPRGYGEAYINGALDITNFDPKHFEGAGVEVAPWPYCENMEQKPKTGRCVDTLVKYLEMVKAGNKTYKAKCMNDMVRNLLFDASATSRIHQSWISGHKEPDRCSYLENAWCPVGYLLKKGIELVFLGTRTGLTRYMKTTENLTDPEFIEQNTNTLDDLYYKRAADIGRDHVVFSTPIKSGVEADIDTNRTMITGSTPLFLQMGNDSSVSTVAAVLGYQMKYNKFQDTFLSVVERCPRDSSGSRLTHCRMTCASSEIECYLLDNNGFVMYAKNEKSVGWFISGVLKYDLFSDMVKKKIFKGILNVTDHNALCEDDSLLANSPAGVLTTPFKWMFSLMTWTLRELAFFIAEWGLLTWFSEYHSVAGAAAYEDDNSPLAEDYLLTEGEGFTEPETSHFYKLFHHDKFNKCQRRQLRVYFGPSSMSHKTCSRNFTLYQANLNVLPKATAINNCYVCRNYSVPENCTQSGGCGKLCIVKGEPCQKAYTVERVKHTNLLLVVVNASCHCERETPVDSPIDSTFDENESLCYKLKESRHRPSQDQPCPSMQVEDSKMECGATTTACTLGFFGTQILVLMLCRLLSS